MTCPTWRYPRSRRLLSEHQRTRIAIRRSVDARDPRVVVRPGAARASWAPHGFHLAYLEVAAVRSAAATDRHAGRREPGKRRVRMDRFCLLQPAHRRAPRHFRGHAPRHRDDRQARGGRDPDAAVQPVMVPVGALLRRHHRADAGVSCLPWISKRQDPGSQRALQVVLRRGKHALRQCQAEEEIRDAFIGNMAASRRPTWQSKRC